MNTCEPRTGQRPGRWPGTVHEAGDLQIVVGRGSVDASGCDDHTGFNADCVPIIDVLLCGYEVCPSGVTTLPRVTDGSIAVALSGTHVAPIRRCCRPLCLRVARRGARLPIALAGRGILNRNYKPIYRDPPLRSPRTRSPSEGGHARRPHRLGDRVRGHAGRPISWDPVTGQPVTRPLAHKGSVVSTRRSRRGRGARRHARGHRERRWNRASVGPGATVHPPLGARAGRWPVVSLRKEGHFWRHRSTLLSVCMMRELSTHLAPQPTFE
jgi:hypothetical protein